MKKKDTGTEPKLATKTKSDNDPALLELFSDSICDLYWAENHLVKSLPKMIAAAGAAELKNTISNHLEETRTHVKRLEQIFKLLGKDPIAKKCDAMEGLVREGEVIVESTTQGTATREVGIILAGQKVEHYEIASYGGLYQLANTLGLPEIAEILAQTLEEEKAADLKLSAVAENEINYQAAQEA
ncbi:YciE/YciF ferroxidase family protein [Pedobacter rhizosphaerae]|uniref:Ferritin-like metal-binding protein YciE n=1 Tax=Pedobacter rhizosphaerae TaxID=390241 RepID=A0A1H9WA36_9SPHI|nr:ferritin-like domain-containing protein [Pedobacter rhizosphaerae]SES30816.1 Ferritin-like metal-binding protein YciE [Pedobacter rhizosphaerae]